MNAGEVDDANLEHNLPLMNKKKRSKSFFSRRQRISSESSSGEETCKQKKYLKRNSLDSSLSLGYTKAVNDYRNAMRAVGSSAVRSSIEACVVDDDTSENRAGDLTGVPADDTASWLEDDLKCSRQKKKRSKKALYQPLRYSPQPQFPYPRSTHLPDADAFDPAEALSSTQIQAHAPSHVPQPSSAETPAAPAIQASQQPTVQLPTQTSGVTWCTVKVTFSDISLLLPVDSQHRTVNWLAEEAYRRHQLLLDQELPATTNQVRIRSPDGALLLPTDLLCSVLPTALQGANPELMAEIVQPSIHATGVRNRSRTPNRPTPTETSVPPVLVLGSANTLEGLGHISSLTLRRSISNALDTGLLDLSFQALGGPGCANALLEYVKLRAENRHVTKLCLDGNLLSPNDLQERSSSERPVLLLAFQKVLTPHLKELSLADNFLTIDAVITLLSGGQYLPSVPANQITHLCLSHNPLFVQPTDPSRNTVTSPTTLPWFNTDQLFLTDTGASNVPPSTTLSCLLAACPRLIRLELINCDITPTVWQNALVPRFVSTSSFSYSSERTLSNPTVSHLSELDISLNPLSSKMLNTDGDSLFDVLSAPEGKGHSLLSSLRVLSVRGSLSVSGCKRGGTGLVLGDEALSGETWMLCEDFCKDTTTKPSGDVFIACLSRLLDASNFHIQTLDVGCCNLTEGCLPNLQRLLAAPSTTLTSLSCDRNPGLRKGTVWANVLSTSGQASSPLVSLCIDIPLLVTEGDLTATVEAVARKFSPSTCPTPLQEFTLIGSVTWPSEIPIGKKMPLSSTVLTALAQQESTFLDRFLSHVALSFAGRFRKLANVSHQPPRTVFSIR
uniref:ANK_REP_REGION domain-containing protein n=2 Tax=Mesocestoides corti TaxID=53468 RepID=A0A5K3FCP5_MESCO